MKRLTAAAIALVLLPPATAHGQQERSYDYFSPQREMIQRGVQAILQCNGLFTGNRTLEQVFDQELAYLADPVGTAEGGDYVVDRDRKAVAIGAAGAIPTMRAAFREGIGCVIMSRDQTFDDIDDLPVLKTPPPPGDPADIPWPDGDLVEDRPLPAGVDPAAHHPLQQRLAVELEEQLVAAHAGRAAGGEHDAGHRATPFGRLRRHG